MISGIKTAFSAGTLKAKVGAILTVIGLMGLMLMLGYLGGCQKGKSISKEQIARYEKKVADLQATKNKVQTKIQTVVQTEYKDRVVKVVETKWRNREAANTTPAVVVDASDTNNVMVTLTKGMVAVHDAAARNEPVDPVLVADTSASSVGINQLMATVVNNYAAYHTLAASDDAWKSWYNMTKQNYDSTKDVEIKP